MSDFAFRLATPADAESFAKWAAENQQIDKKDLLNSTKEKQPTAVHFVVEDGDGKVILFAPLFAQMALAFIGFNPDTRASEKVRALDTLMDGAMAFAVQFGVRHITTLTKPEYAVAQWALKHDFDAEDRNQLTLDINKVLERELVKVE